MNEFKFIMEKSTHPDHEEVKEKILSLFNEIQNLYKQHIRKPTGKLCDICGLGDKNNIYKIKDVVMGYEHRKHLSPCLCNRHACGWNASYVRSRLMFKGTTDEEIDLHFARHLVNHLTRASRTKLVKQEMI